RHLRSTYCHHRHLLSFPTRRSSDLEAANTSTNRCPKASASCAKTGVPTKAAALAKSAISDIRFCIILASLSCRAPAARYPRFNGRWLYQRAFARDSDDSVAIRVNAAPEGRWSVCGGGRPQRLRLLVAVLLAYMARHVEEHVAHVPVGNLIEDLLGPAIALHEPRTAQQPQVMADQRLRQVEPLGDLAHRTRAVETVEKDRQPARIAEQAKRL